MAIRRILLAAGILALLMGITVLAQPRATGPGIVDQAPMTQTQQTIVTPSNFWLAIVVGVILAVSFELILTHLSVAAGISSVGPFDQRERGEHHYEEHETHTGVMGKIKKGSSLFGIWTLVTATISLFFASWLAIGLANTGSAFRGLVLGLSIWALFYIAMTVLEVTTLTSLVGSLTQTAIGGLRSAYKATASIFGKSEEDRVVDTAERVTAAVRNELFGEMDAKDLRKQIEKYVQQLKPASADDIKDAIRGMLNDVEIRALVEHEEGPFADVDVLTASLETEGGMTREKARTVATNVKDAVAKIREEYRSDKDATSKLTDASMRVAGRSEEEARAVREKIEAYLRNTNKEELNPEGIKQDLEKLYHSPKEGFAALKDRLSHFDRSTFKAILAQRKDMTEQEADKTVDRVMSVVDRIRGKTAEAVEGAEEAVAQRRGVEARIRDYVNSIGRPELRYEGIKHDMEVLFHDPKAGADLLIRRLKAMDRDTLKAIVATRKDMSPEDAEHVVSQMERARDETIAKYEQMRTEVQHRIEDAKDKALHEAEEARQVARTAAWWTFGSALVSAGAAIVGGILSVYT
ncbi:MAG: hypothetical protein ACM3VT_02425 [Solirubrobacterales bacterium]